MRIFLGPMDWPTCMVADPFRTSNPSGIACRRKGRSNGRHGPDILKPGDFEGPVREQRRWAIIFRLAALWDSTALYFQSELAAVHHHRDAPICKA